MYYGFVKKEPYYIFSFHYSEHIAKQQLQLEAGMRCRGYRYIGEPQTTLKMVKPYTVLAK